MIFGRRRRPGPGLRGRSTPVVPAQRRPHPPGAVIDQSLVSGGTRGAGEVRGSVLAPGVVVEKGATVVDSVLLPGARVRSGARVRRSVLDDLVDVGEGVVSGDGDVTLVGRRARVEPDGEVAAGARLPEPEKA